MTILDQELFVDEILVWKSILYQEIRIIMWRNLNGIRNSVELNETKGVM